LRAGYSLFWGVYPLIFGVVNRVGGSLSICISFFKGVNDDAT
jgi:hypothetical protein